MKKMNLYLFTILLLFLCGCKKEPVTVPVIDTAFETEVNSICSSIASLHKEMNSIRPESEQGCSDMLLKLDKMEKEFENLAALDFAENFEYLKPYAEEAYNYMTEAVNVYNEIYSVTDYDSSKDEYAKENYKRAFKRLNAILAVLRGENPNQE